VGEESLSGRMNPPSRRQVSAIVYGGSSGKADEEYHPDCGDLKFCSGLEELRSVQQSLVLSSFPAERSSTPQPTHMYEWSLSVALVPIWHQFCEEYE